MSFFENIVSTVLFQSGCFELDQAFGESTQPTLMSQNLPNIERQLKRASFASQQKLPLSPSSHLPLPDPSFQLVTECSSSPTLPPTKRPESEKWRNQILQNIMQEDVYHICQQQQKPNGFTQLRIWS